MKEITQSIFKKENKGKKMTISIFFFKNRIIIMINPFRKRSERGFVFIRQGIFKNSDDRRPAASGIILADLQSFSKAYLPRQRFSFKTRLNIARFDKDFVETLSFGRNLRLRPAYNDIYELTGVSGADSHSYAYDNVGNRTTVDSVNYTSNTLNQYSQVASTNFSYDGNDNLADDGTNDYTYDESNRLLMFNNGTDSATYEYDAFNRRVSKTVNSVTTYYVYDGNEVIEEYNSSDVLQADYVMGSRIDEPLTMTRSSTTYYYHLDGLGNIRQITNSSGVTQESYDYDPYGNTTIYNSAHSPVSASVIGNRFMFTGREYDEESGIYHYRRRYYAPAIGRFLERDPLGYIDSMNLFQYVNNNSINNIDPLGLLVDGHYDLSTGDLTITDRDTGESITVKADSGGKPHGAPIPTGKYDILDQAQNPEFYRLDPKDNKPRNDRHDPTGRDRFRLHGPGQTIGCIACADPEIWKKIQEMIEETAKETVTDESVPWWKFWDRDITLFGELTVTDCP